MMTFPSLSTCHSMHGSLASLLSLCNIELILALLPVNSTILLKPLVRHSTTLSYPPIKNSFNGCQGHPLVCLPPGTAQRQRNPEVKRLNAQQFIQLTLVDSCRWHKMRKAVEVWKQKRSAYYDMYIMILRIHTLRHLFLTWTSLCLSTL